MLERVLSRLAILYKIKCLHQEITQSEEEKLAMEKRVFLAEEKARSITQTSEERLVKLLL